jgi:hypothetical protein
VEVAVGESRRSSGRSALCARVPNIDPWITGHGQGRSPQPFGSLHFLEVRQDPFPVEVIFCGRVKAEVGKPRLAGHRGNPVLLRACLAILTTAAEVDAWLTAPMRWRCNGRFSTTR